jgi:pimeloyl-ACP methyl ester carboxylesterase
MTPTMHLLWTPAPDPAAADADFDCTRVGTSDGFRLQVLRWRPHRPTGLPRIVFVAGWVSIVEGWVPVLKALGERAEILYVETREKRSAELPKRRLRPADFSIPRMADDLVEACAQLGADDGDTLLVASSMGANAALEALKDGRLAARAAFLVAPNGEFHYPWWGHLLVRMPAAGYRVIRPLVAAYLRRHRVNTEADPAQMRRYERTLEEAEPHRLKLSAQSAVRYRLLPRLDTVRIPVAVAYASSDTLHGGCQCEAIVDRLASGRLVRCPTNSFMHDVGVVDEIEAFVASLDPAADRFATAGRP